MKGKIDLNTVWEMARQAGEKAAAEYDNSKFGGCGFAWIVVENGRTKFAKFAKEQLRAHKNHYNPGVCIWYSQICSGASQNISEFEAACYAAAAVLKEHGIACHVESRLD